MSDADFSPRQDMPVYVISVAAELAGLHAQTLRTYDRLGLVTPGRTAGGGRRYSARDIALVREVQRLSNEGVNLEGIKRVLELEREVGRLRHRLDRLESEEKELRANHRSYSVVLVTKEKEVYFLRLTGTDKAVTAAAAGFRASFGADASKEKDYEI